MAPITRRVIQVVLYTFGAAAFTEPVPGVRFDASMDSAHVPTVVMPVIGLAWNDIFDALCECRKSHPTYRWPIRMAAVVNDRMVMFALR